MWSSHCEIQRSSLLCPGSLCSDNSTSQHSLSLSHPLFSSNFFYSTPPHINARSPCKRKNQKFTLMVHNKRPSIGVEPGGPGEPCSPGSRPTLHTSPHWFPYIAVQLDCVLTEEESPQVLMFLETREELPRFVAFKTNVRNTSASETKVHLLSGI